MQIRRLTAIAALALALCAPSHAFSKKPKVTVRFHTEANQRDSGTFAMPVRLVYAQRDTTLKRTPEFSERQIKAIFPFKTTDETWGCTFILDEQGRIRLETMSNEQRGSALVVYVGTKTGQHQVVDMVIDRPIPSGMITVPRGLTELEVEHLRKAFPVLGEEKKKAKAEKDLPEPVPGSINRDRDTRENAHRIKTGRPAAAEADIPRFRD